jgi:rhamnogalacturonyl hydrolase YesR
LGQHTYLDAATSACHFLASDVPRHEPDTDRLCFSKMPGLRWHVHNANLMVAATLATVGRVAGTDQWNDLVRRAVNYTLAEQREDGAWYYWGPPDRLLRWVDHYHTGFVLRALDDLLAATGWPDLREPLDRGYAFYTRRLFDEGYIPRLTDTRRYPIDIHSCAEAILCLGQLANRYDDALARARLVAEWTLVHMRHPDGYFYYRRYRWLTIKIPYVRWGQAWMMAALARLQRALAN